jgi:hypothetical protein
MRRVSKKIKRLEVLSLIIRKTGIPNSEDTSNGYFSVHQLRALLLYIERQNQEVMELRNSLQTLTDRVRTYDNRPESSKSEGI